MFAFRDIRRIEGSEIDLVLKRRSPADKSRGYVPAYIFAIVPHGTDTEAGFCDLRVGHNDNTFYGGNIGYGVHENFRGSHFAAKACLLMKELAVSHGMDHLIITCDPDNIASRKTCEYIGAALLEIFELPEWTELYKLGKRMKCRYRWEIGGES